MRQVMEYCNTLDLPVIDHCEDPSLFAGGVMREGARSIRLGLKGIPAESESICAGRDVEVAGLTGSAAAHRASFDDRGAGVCARGEERRIESDVRGDARTTLR